MSPLADDGAKEEQQVFLAVPFETIVKKGVLVKEIEERKQGLVDRCQGNNGLTLKEVCSHNDWLLQLEKDLSKARARIERDFRISNALALKVREGKRKAQLQQRLDVLRAQCDVLNDGIHSLSDHCAWFQESGTYREAVEYLEGRRDEVEDSTLLDDHPSRFEKGANKVSQGSQTRDDDSRDWTAHRELEGLIHEDPGEQPQAQKKNRRRKKKKGLGGDAAEPGGAGGDDSGAEDEGEEKLSKLQLNNPFVGEFVAPFTSLKAAGRGLVGDNSIDVWAID